MRYYRLWPDLGLIVDGRRWIEYPAFVVESPIEVVVRDEN